MILNLITLMVASYTSVLVGGMALVALGTKQSVNLKGWLAVPLYLLPFLAVANGLVVAS